MSEIVRNLYTDCQLHILKFLPPTLRRTLCKRMRKEADKEMKSMKSIGPDELLDQSLYMYNPFTGDDEMYYVENLLEEYLPKTPTLKITDNVRVPLIYNVIHGDLIISFSGTWIGLIYLPVKFGSIDPTKEVILYVWGHPCSTYGPNRRITFYKGSTFIDICETIPSIGEGLYGVDDTVLFDSLEMLYQHRIK